MYEGFIVVKEGAEGIYEEKKSRFIAKVYKTDNESEAGSYIEEARKNIGMQGIIVMHT